MRGLYPIARARRRRRRRVGPRPQTLRPRAWRANRLTGRADVAKAKARFGAALVDPFEGCFFTCCWFLFVATVAADPRSPKSPAAVKHTFSGRAGEGART